MNSHRLLVLIVATIFLPLSAATQDKQSESEPKLSNDPLTIDQLAVYQAVLHDYSNGSDEPLNVAETTFPFNREDRKGCIKWGSEKSNDSALFVHRLNQLATLDSKLKIVDPIKQQKKVDENDTQKLIKGAIDDGQQVTEKQLDDSLKLAFHSALFSFSEVVFDKQHRRAVLSYSFVCGSLCGHGNTVVLVKSGQNWKISKHCGGWVS